MKVKTGKMAYLMHKDGSKERVRIVYFPLLQSTSKDHDATFSKKHLEPIDQRCLKLSELLKPYRNAISKVELSGRMAKPENVFNENELKRFRAYMDEYAFLAKERKITELHMRFNSNISRMIEQVESMFLMPAEKLALVENSSMERFEVKAKYLK